MTSCPNCGFDLDADGRCAVCGFASGRSRSLETARPAALQRGAVGGGGSEGDESLAVPRGASSAISDVRLGRRHNRPLLIAAAVVLGALVAVGYLVVRNNGGASEAVARVGRAADAGRVKKPPGPAPRETIPRSKGASPAVTSTPGSPAPASRSISASKGSGRPEGSAVGTLTVSRVGFSAPVGASPASIRATHPIDLYNPSVQPVFDITKRRSLPPLTSEHAYVKWMLQHTHQQEKFLRERWIRAMKAVDRRLLVRRRVLTAFLLTPREWFVRSYNLKDTYRNTALPIGYGQTISGPDLVAHMTDALDPQPNQRVLEIGTGSGYQSAVLSQLSNFVYTIEIVRPLAVQTSEIYLEHTKAMPEYANIHRRLADGYYGWPEYAPFDRIIVTTGIDHIPPDLLKELKPGGIMVIPIGPPTGQTILKITKTVDKEGRVHLKRQNLYPGVTDIFVPFTASGGGTHDTGSGRK